MNMDTAQLLRDQLYVLAFMSFFGCLVMMALARFLPRLRGRVSDETAVQAMHVGLTPRVGGAAIFGTLALSALLAPEQVLRTYIEFIVATSLIFAVGLKEDLGFHVSPRLRLLTVSIASLIAIALIGEWLGRIGLPVVDQLMEYWFIGIPFTLLITAGVSNGFNLIDGVNGLAALTAMFAATAMANIAQEAGFVPMVGLGMMLTAVVAGFFILNFPFGLIFLGDAGAYTIGFVLAWFGIAILINAPAVSPWAILLTLFWPLADTLLAMYRRARGKRDAMLPDRLHFHQLVMRGIEICVVGRRKRHLSNALTTVVLAPFVITPPITAMWLWDNNLWAFVAVLLFLGLFFGSYNLTLAVIQKRRQRLTVS